MNADGAGSFTSDTLGAGSPLSSLQLTGNYSVNPDCSGTAVLKDSNGQSQSINFVLVGTSGAQQLPFVFSGTGITGSGTGLQQ